MTLYQEVFFMKREKYKNLNEMRKKKITNFNTELAIMLQS